MELSYDRLSWEDLRGTSAAHHTVQLDGRLTLRDGQVTIFDEPGFPVVELAGELQKWLAEAQTVDFEFVSMSYEEAGTLSIRRVGSSWVFGSVLEPGVTTEPTGRREVERCCRHFIASVEAELRRNGVDLRDVDGS